MHNSTTRTVASRICDARSLPSRNISIGTPLNGEIVARDANCIGARNAELREHDAGRERDQRHPYDDFECDEHLRGDAAWKHLAVADGRHRLHAEEEMVEDRTGTRSGDAADPKERNREEEVDEQEHAGERERSIHQGSRRNWW